MPSTHAHSNLGAHLEVCLRLVGHRAGGLALARRLEQRKLGAVLVHRGLVVHAVAHLVLQAGNRGSARRRRVCVGANSVLLYKHARPVPALASNLSMAWSSSWSALGSCRIISLNAAFSRSWPTCGLQQRAGDGPQRLGRHSDNGSRCRRRRWLRLQQEGRI